MLTSKLAQKIQTRKEKLGKTKTFTTDKVFFPKAIIRVSGKKYVVEKPVNANSDIEACHALERFIRLQGGEWMGAEIENVTCGTVQNGDGDYRGYKVTDQIIKGFMIYKSYKPGIFTAKNENGKEYEGTMEQVKKQIDDYWVKQDEDVMKQKVRDEAGINPVGPYKGKLIKECPTDYVGHLYQNAPINSEVWKEAKQVLQERGVFKKWEKYSGDSKTKDNEFNSGDHVKGKGGLASTTGIAGTVIKKVIVNFASGPQVRYLIKLDDGGEREIRADELTKDSKTLDASVGARGWLQGKRFKVYAISGDEYSILFDDGTKQVLKLTDLKDVKWENNGQATSDSKPKHPRWRIKDDKLFRLRSAVKDIRRRVKDAELNSRAVWKKEDFDKMVAAGNFTIVSKQPWGYEVKVKSGNIYGVEVKDSKSKDATIEFYDFNKWKEFCISKGYRVVKTDKYNTLAHTEGKLMGGFHSRANSGWVEPSVQSARYSYGSKDSKDEETSYKGYHISKGQHETGLSGYKIDNPNGRRPLMDFYKTIGDAKEAIDKFGIYLGKDSKDTYTKGSADKKTKDQINPEYIRKRKILVDQLERAKKNRAPIETVENITDMIKKLDEDYDRGSAKDKYTGDPLTAKGQKILAKMKKQYGKKKGTSVFYASKNKGTITGVDGKTKDVSAKEIRRQIDELKRRANDKTLSKQQREYYKEKLQTAESLFAAYNPVWKSKGQYDSKTKDNVIFMKAVLQTKEGKKLITKPVVANSIEEAKQKMRNAIEGEIKNGHLLQGEIVSITSDTKGTITGVDGKTRDYRQPKTVKYKGFEIDPYFGQFSDGDIGDETYLIYKNNKLVVSKEFYTVEEAKAYIDKKYK